jgi:predicted permease
MGRAFTAEEDRPGGPRVAVLGHAVWTARLGSDPTLIGRTITLNGEPYTVVGILSARFRSDPPADMFIPLQADPNSTNQGHFLSVAARLNQGVTIERARAELKLIGDQFRRANPRWMSNDEQVTVLRMQDVVVRDVRPALLILFGAVILVLLIACANVANLLLARSAARQKEIAVRTALGASRRQIVRQLLTESVLLSGIGGALGVLAGLWGVRALIALSPGDLPRAEELSTAPVLASLLDWRLLAFASAVSLATGLLFGLAPALQLSRPGLSGILKDAGTRGATNVRLTRARGLLVVAETALAVVLLIGAALLIRTFIGLRTVAPGIESHNVLTLQTSLAGQRYATTPEVERLTRRVVERLDSLPGVEAAALTVSLPVEGGPDLPFRIEGRALAADAQFHGDEQWRFVSPQYFKALKIPLLRGRSFDERDAQSAPPVVLVNAAMAAKYWPSQDAVGQRITIGKGLGPEFEDPTREIVGVVGDVREEGLDRPAPPVMYVPAAQMPDALTRLGNSIVPMTWIVRSASAPTGLAGAIQREIQAADRQLAVARVRPLDQVLAQSIARQNFNMLLLTVFGAIALVLAAIGIYGLMSYSVEQRSHEIGIRMALGAARTDILTLVVGGGMRLAGAGVVTGIAAALGVTRVLSRLLFGVRSTDPATFAAVAVMLSTVAWLACYLPARRATRVDPIVALRYE